MAKGCYWLSQAVTSIVDVEKLLIPILLDAMMVMPSLLALLTFPVFLAFPVLSACRKLYRALGQPQDHNRTLPRLSRCQLSVEVSLPKIPCQVRL
jgi:hypothetical protein